MNKTGWLIYNKEDAERNKPFIEWFIDEANKQGLNLYLKHRESLSIGLHQNKLSCWENGVKANLPHFAVVRTIEPTLNEQLEMLNVACFNSSHIARICNNKAKTHQLLAQKGIPMVDTLFYKGNSISDLPFSYPLIIKEVAGRGGKEVYWVENQQEIHNLPIDSQRELIVQKPAPQLGKDLRVFIVGNEVVGSILRENSQEFKANYTLGGSATHYELSEEEEKLVHRILESFQFGMVGIDFLFDEDNNLLLNEIEDVVGSRTLYKETSVNILQLYIAHIRRSII